jgi:hypothetical protein
MGTKSTREKHLSPLEESHCSGKRKQDLLSRRHSETYPSLHLDAQPHQRNVSHLTYLQTCYPTNVYRTPVRSSLPTTNPAVPFLGPELTANNLLAIASLVPASIDSSVPDDLTGPTGDYLTGTLAVHATPLRDGRGVSPCCCPAPLSTSGCLLFFPRPNHPPPLPLVWVVVVAVLVVGV